MKIFLAFRFTGESVEELDKILSKIKTALEQAGHTVVCSFWEEEYFQKNHFTNKQLLEYMLNELDNCDSVLALIKSEEKSEGMLLEIGYALAKRKQFVLMIKKGIKSIFLQEVANRVVEYEEMEDLVKQLQML